MGPGRLTGMNAGVSLGIRSERARFNGARSIDRDERRRSAGARQGRRGASMGPGRLTGMNVRSRWAPSSRRARFNGARSIDRDERMFGCNLCRDLDCWASMGPGRLTGMNAEETLGILGGSCRFNGARSIDRDERRRRASIASSAAALQWGPVD